MTNDDTTDSIIDDAMDLQRIRKRIREFAASPKNVHFDELATLLDNHISALFSNYNHHHSSSHHAFTVGSETFTIAESKRGNLKEVYVKEFLNHMEAVGLYDPEEKP